ncbi:MAG TPA: TrkH family potassium uptake protein [Bacillota bacterium]|nr:TrkH family potassium uptake protein [Bacillota bacterium]
MASIEGRIQAGALRPARKLVLGFAGAITAGTLLLALPWSTADGRGLGLVDAFFTATSAVCVTGLSVIDIGTRLSRFGQVAVLLLIQVGGLGIMTLSTIAAVVIGKRIGLAGRLAVKEAIGVDELAGLVRLIRIVVTSTLAIEGIGAILLTLLFARDFPLVQAAWYGVFHAVSAFNNAGLSLFAASLEAYAGDIWVNLVFMALIVLGGIGFYVLADVWQNGRRLSVHSRLAIWMSAGLILAGMAIILAAEWANPATLGALPPGERLLAAAFQSVTPRTAGFNTVPIGQFRDGTLLVLIVLMVIGASPGSTGGGIKTTTFWVLLASVHAILTGRDEIVVFERRLSRLLTDKALVILVLTLAVLLATTALLTATEPFPFLDVLFEAVSAFGTVGLSTGITSELSVFGRLLLPLTMFVGRLGPITVALAIAQRQRAAGVRYPEDRVMVG